MQPARSLVITPFSTVSTHTFSNVWQNLKGVAIQSKLLFSKMTLHMRKWETNEINILYQIRISIQFASVLQSPGPGKDARNRIGTSGSSLQGTANVRYWKLQLLSIQPHYATVLLLVSDPCSWIARVHWKFCFQSELCWKYDNVEQRSSFYTETVYSGGL